MRTDVIFRDIKMFDHLKDFVERLAAEATMDMARSKDAHTVVIIGKSAARTNTHGPMFQCTVLVRGGMLPSPLFAKKENKDFYTALRNTLAVIKKKVRKASQRRLPQRRVALEDLQGLSV